MLIPNTLNLDLAVTNPHDRILTILKRVCDLLL